MTKGAKITVWALGAVAVLSLVVNGLFWYANRHMANQHAAAFGTQIATLKGHYLDSVQNHLAVLPEGDEGILGRTIASEKLMNAGFTMTRMHSLDPEHDREWSDLGLALVQAGIEVRLTAFELQDAGELSPGCVLRFEEARALVDRIIGAMPSVEGSLPGNAATVGRTVPRITFDEAAMQAAVVEARDYTADAEARQRARNQGGRGCDPQVVAQS